MQSLPRDMVLSYLLEPSQISQVWLPCEPLDVPEPPIPRLVAVAALQVQNVVQGGELWLQTWVCHSLTACVGTMGQVDCEHRHGSVFQHV